MKIVSLGPAGRLGPAIIPVPACDARAWSSAGPVSGNPGTLLVPAPLPEAVPQDYPFTALHTSADAAPFWRPGVYYQPVPAALPPVSVQSDNQMPVPAGTPNGKPAYMLRRPRFLGQSQVPAGSATPVYPPWWKTRIK